jgi:hypothetical protein
MRFGINLRGDLAKLSDASWLHAWIRRGKRIMERKASEHGGLSCGTPAAALSDILGLIAHSMFSAPLLRRFLHSPLAGWILQIGKSEWTRIAPFAKSMISRMKLNGAWRHDRRWCDDPHS